MGRGETGGEPQSRRPQMAWENGWAGQKGVAGQIVTSETSKSPRKLLSVDEPPADQSHPPYSASCLVRHTCR